MATEEESSNSTCAVSDHSRVKRLLLLGTEGSTYKTNNTKDFDLENTQTLCRLLESGHGEELVSGIVSCMDKNPANPDSLVFALAVCARMAKEQKTRQAAYRVLGDVCKSPAQLFHFVSYAEKVSGPTTGWGRAQRKAISDWYNGKATLLLAQAVTKIKQRYGWSHMDVLRLAHVKASKDSTALLLKYVMKGLAKAKEESKDAVEGVEQVAEFLEAVETVKHSSDEHLVAQLVEKHSLSQHHIPTWMQNSKEVWSVLLRQTELEDLLPQLGRLTGAGVLDPAAPLNQTQALVDRLTSDCCVVESRLNPMDVLIARKAYEAGKREKSKPKWVANSTVLDALNSAFYSSFKNISATGKRYLVAVNVNSSMSFGAVSGLPSMRPLEAAAAVAMMAARTEQSYELVAYSQTVGPVRLSAQMTLQEVCLAISEVPMGGSDCALPILWAAEHQKAIDVFIVVTDCDKWAGQIPPSEALRNYRHKMNIPEARLAVCALTNQNFKLADGKDAGMLDIVSFDSSLPHIIHNFACGHL